MAKPRLALLTVPPWKHRGYLLLIRRIRSSRLNKTKSPWKQADIYSLIYNKYGLIYDIYSLIYNIYSPETV